MFNKDEKADPGVNVDVEMKHTKSIEKNKMKSDQSSGNVQEAIIETKKTFELKKFESTTENKSDKTSVHKSNTKSSKHSYEKSRKISVPGSNNNSVQRSNISSEKKSSSKCNINSNIKSKNKSGVTSDIQAKSDIKTESRSDIKSAAKADSKSVAKSNSKIVAKSLTKSDIKNVTISEIKSVTKSDIKSMNNFDFKTMSKCIKSIIKSDLKSETDMSETALKPITKHEDLETEAFAVKTQSLDKSKLGEMVSKEITNVAKVKEMEEHKSVLVNVNKPNEVRDKSSCQLEQNIFIGKDVEVIQGNEKDNNLQNDVSLKLRESKLLTPGFNEIINHQNLRLAPLSWML